MTHPALEALTPIRIRGRRKRDPLFTWHAGKRRKAELHQPCSESEPALHNEVTLKTRRMKQLGSRLSSLESLPIEITQYIFILSRNLDLPFASVCLLEKTSNSPHLCTEMTDALMSRVVGHQKDREVYPHDLVTASRLLNSRCMTWALFSSWLRAQSADNDDDASIDFSWSARWSQLKPAPGLLPPRKLLSPPFDDDGVKFLGVFVEHGLDLTLHDPSYVDLAYSGLTKAIEDDCPEMVGLFLDAGLQSNLSLLRIAVADSNCPQLIVQLLVGASHSTRTPLLESNAEETVDFLDPVLWNWAERARDAGNEKGEWLMQLLKDAHRAREDINQ